MRSLKAASALSAAGITCAGTNVRLRMYRPKQNLQYRWPIPLEWYAVTMKPVILFSAIALLATGIAQAADDKSVALEQEVLAAEHSWLDAIKKSDSKELQAILRDDYINIESSGQIQNKIQAMNSADDVAADPKKAGSTTLSMSAVRVRLYGPTAVLTGAAAIGGSKTVGIRFTHIWVKSGDHWLLSSSQATRIAPLANAPKVPVKIQPLSH
jgi:ketosteroid isomerase-like protein